MRISDSMNLRKRKKGGERMRYIDARALKKAMIDKDIKTVAELEEKSGVNRNTLAGILKGEGTPSYETITGLADALALDGETTGRIFFALELA